MNAKKITEKKIVAGVLAGFAYSFGLKTWLVRAAYILLGVFTGLVPAVVIYAILAVMMPQWDKTPENYSEVCE